MTGPDDLRVGDAERTKVTEALHDHFAQGRLTREELDERVDATLAAKTFSDLRQITRDLPGPAPVADHTPDAAPPFSGPGRRPRGLPLLPLAIGVFLAIMLFSGGTMWALFGVFKVIFLVWLVMALVGFVHLRRWRRRGRPPWSPGRRQGPYGSYGSHGPFGPHGGYGGRWQRRGRGGW